MKMRGTVHLIGILLVVSGGFCWAVMASLALKSLERALGMKPAPVPVSVGFERLSALHAARQTDHLPFVLRK